MTTVTTPQPSTTNYSILFINSTPRAVKIPCSLWDGSSRTHLWIRRAEVSRRNISRSDQRQSVLTRSMSEKGLTPVNAGDNKRKAGILSLVTETLLWSCTSGVIAHSIYLHLQYLHSPKQEAQFRFLRRGVSTLIRVDERCRNLQYSRLQKQVY